MARGPRKNLTNKPAVKNTTVEAVKEQVAVKAEPVEAPKPVETKAEEPVKTAKKPGRKPAAKKASAPAVKKTAGKKEDVPAAKKRAPRKPKVITVDDVVAKIDKKLDKSVAAELAPDRKVAADIKLYGAFEAHMYIEIKDGNVNVAPYDYIEKDLEVAVPVDVALAIADGKTTVKEAVENGSLYAAGNVQCALILAKLFK